MQPRWGTSIIAAAAASLALTASAQQATPFAPNSLTAATQAQPAQSEGTVRRPGRFVRAPLREARLLAVDMQGARGQSRSPINQRGRLINLKFIATQKVLIDQITIPVLLPSEPLLAEHLRIFPNAAHYAVSSSSPGMSFHMTGHGRAFDLMPAAVRRLPRADLRARIPADGVVIEHTEFGLDASFNRFGAAYSISLECADPADPRCTSDVFVRGLISRLMVVVPGEAP
jgi:hypothetical protein